MSELQSDIKEYGMHMTAEVIKSCINVVAGVAVNGGKSADCINALNELLRGVEE